MSGHRETRGGLDMVERAPRAHHNRTLRRIFAAGVVTLGLVTLLGATDGHAQRRIEFQKGGKGAAQSPALGNTQTTGPALRLTGKATVDASGQVRVGKTVVFITGRTGVFPALSSRGRDLDTRRLNGREVTVYGKRTANGLSANLVIVTGGEEAANTKQPKSDLRIAGAKDSASYRVPSDTSDDVGELLDEAPQ